ncbi:MAG: protein kinase [Muribaculaceae bacterium]|nr:protein kinase [Muribaculaceae bacterium]
MINMVNRCEFNPGDIIDANYIVQRTLGTGSFGVVYLVIDCAGNEFALKLLKLWEVPSEIRNPMIARFDMEFQTGQIKSKYLVHSYSHGIECGNPYIVMDYCPGGDLYQNSSSLDLSKVAHCVLLGLKSLHQSGKVHRDLKPENVLKTRSGDFALTDFGIAGDRTKRMTEMNIVGKPKQIFGTYAYMPPEQVNPRRDATVLPTTDIFSFGVMMYQLITGFLPFGDLNDEKSLIPYLKKGKQGDWNRESLINSSAGKDWYNLIEGCLQPQIHNRLQDVDSVLKTLPFGQRQICEEYHTDSFSKKIVNGLLLRVMHGEEHGRIYYLDDIVNRKRNSILLMGRLNMQSTNDIAIREDNSTYVSRSHCTLELDYNLGEWVIRDGQWQSKQWRKSTNGTFLNSSEVNMIGSVIKPGDIISIGDTKLRVEAY